MSEGTGISFQELDEVIELIHKIYGFDFSNYSSASLKRRVTRVMGIRRLSFFGFKALLVNDPVFFEFLLKEITVNVTEMFRDPAFYRSLRENVLPYLASFQRIKVWNAGCSSGEEVYSFAVLFEEQNLYDRTFIYGTDINQDVLEKARNGIYELRKMKLYSENYQETGAERSLSNFYTARYDAAAVHESLKRNTLFSIHNLISDNVFNEFHLISCRNVLIYFNAELQKRVIELFYNSLRPLGFLCLGAKESLRHNQLIDRFKVIDQKENIYQKIG